MGLIPTGTTWPIHQKAKPTIFEILKKKTKKKISYFEVKFSRRIALMIQPPSQLRIGKETGGKFCLELNPAARKTLAQPLKV